MSKEMLLKPRISEQTFSQAEEDGLYVFVVPKSANKSDIKAAVEEQFNVTVHSINTSILKGRTRSSARRRQQSIDGTRPEIKKAYVKLKKGDKITVLDAGV